MNDTISDMGIVRQMMKVALHLPRKNITTSITNMNANITDCDSDEILSRIDSEVSLITSIFTSAGSDA